MANKSRMSVSQAPHPEQAPMALVKAVHIVDALVDQPPDLSGGRSAAAADDILFLLWMGVAHLSATSLLMP
ncbi:MAG TPA: hypothetical protein VI457_07990 [Methylococcaceae bacterium]|nr:hypothetical protein [Methylococcaceae bacterium]